MHQILDNLYQGAMPKKALPPEITAIINLINVDQGIADNASCQLDFHGRNDTIVAYVHLPIYDGPYLGLEWLKMAVGIVELLMQENVVYIHCHAGISRSSMLTAAVVMKKMGLNAADTLTFIAEKNPNVAPAYNFLKMLKQYDSFLKE